MQQHRLYTVPALLLALLFFTSSGSYGQTVSAAAIQATATVEAPLGATFLSGSSVENSSASPCFFVVCPARANVQITVNEDGNVLHGEDLPDARESDLPESNQAVMRIFDGSQLMRFASIDSMTIVTVIYTEN